MKTFQPPGHPCSPFHCLVFVNTLICMRFFWMFNTFNQCVLMVSETGFMITVMSTTDCRLSAVRSSATCIAVVVALSFGVKKRLMSTFFICCTEEEIYACCVAAMFSGNSSLAYAALVTHSLDYVVFTRLYDFLHFLTSFDY